MLSRYLVPIFLAAAVFAQQPAEQKPAIVEGAVLNSVTGEPIRKAELTLSNGQITQAMAAMAEQVRPGSLPPGTRVATTTLAGATDTAGRFRFEQVAPGTYWLTAKKPGFADGRYPVSAGGAGSGLQLASGQELKGVEIRITPHGTITGRVVDEDGEPMPSAMVTALAYGYAHGRRRLAPADIGQTNNRGEFSLSKLPPGKYVLSANVMRVGGLAPAPAPPADGSPETAYVSTYFPGTVDAAQAQQIEVGPGAELGGFAIPLQKSHVVRVKGKLTDANGQPMKTAQIMVIGASGNLGSMSATAVNDPEGKFELTNIQPGSYTIMAVQMAGGAPKISMQPLMVPNRNLENVTLGAQPEATIQGKLTVEGDAKPDLKSVAVTLAPGPSIAVMPAYGRPDATGAFTIEHVTQASYDLAITAMPEGTYLKSVLFNDRERLGQEIDMTGLTSGALRVVLGADGAQVTARVVRDGNPAPKAMVVLLPSDPARRFPEAVRVGTSDQNGTVALKDVPPGNYLGFAWEKIDTDAWYDPEFVKTVQSKAAGVKIEPKGNQELKLDLIPASK